ncbi:hypothetical protein V6N11_061719, partial [Hibiscus sabdariffa]
LGSRNNASKRGLASTAGLDWMAQVTGVGLGGRGDLRRRQSRVTDSQQADAWKRIYDHCNGDRGRVWCGVNGFRRIPTSDGWYGGGKSGGDVRVSGLG